MQIRLTDNGIGIEKEDLKHIFERLYKCDKGRAEKGSGLGLSIDVYKRQGLAPVELAGLYRKTGDVRAVCHHKFYLDNQPVSFPVSYTHL